MIQGEVYVTSAFGNNNWCGSNITHFILGVNGELYLLVIEYPPTTVFIINVAENAHKYFEQLFDYLILP